MKEHRRLISDRTVIPLVVVLLDEFVVGSLVDFPMKTGGSVKPKRPGLKLGKIL